VARGPTIATILDGPRKLISLDLMGPLPRGQLGSRYILAMIDVFSKHIQLYAIRKADASTIIKRIREEYIPKMGHFERILTNNGTQFHSKKWEEAML
jgi:hypothetical protein